MNEATTQIGDDVSPDLSYKQTKDFFNPLTRCTNRERKANLRANIKSKRYGQPPQNRDDKYIAKIGTLPMRQLIRRLKQAARHASHFKHTIERSDDYVAAKLRPLHDYALMCYTRLQTEIEFRTAPRED